MKQFKSQFLAAGLSALFLAGITASAHAATQGAETEPSVMVLHQKISGGELMVDYAYLPKKGYVVVYAADKEGNAVKEPIGHLALDAGSHVKFKVKIDKVPEPGTKLWVSLYEDKDGKEGFDRQADAALWNKLPYENHIVVQ